MTILTPIISVFTILLYFAISLFMPFFSYLVPSYKIKKVNIFGNKYKLIINISVALVLYILNIKILLIYLIYPAMTEFLFYFTQKFIFKFKIKTFDRIIIMSLISTTIIISLIFYNRDYVEKLFMEALKVSSPAFNLDKLEIYNSFLFLKENILSSIFSYLFIGNIFLFLTLSPKTYEKWRISCYWILPFIFIVLERKILNVSFNLYLEENILKIVKYIYVFYGIKTIYKIEGSIGIKFDFIKHLFSIILGILYPLPIFILGALNSFDIIEVKTIIDKKNIK